jgi:hypothetical protein
MRQCSRIIAQIRIFDVDSCGLMAGGRSNRVKNFLSAGGELTRPYLVHISSTSPQGRTAAGESSRCIKVKVFEIQGVTLIW